MIVNMSSYISFVFSYENIHTWITLQHKLILSYDRPTAVWYCGKKWGKSFI